ncbi:abortive infection family protein [Pelotomaculum terephthalicicum JT]|uniref:abortive infection family protein n=1 Tax=Pelotomaculum terephthalicicum TaxID=206393 RepID=UPI001F0488D3|nr:abortive infection family protein [Pelotomaculum terephthalicicum]MCG9967350.1 abortive infection family protein [Pelotomaculum terephthalicicum JT]
MKNITDVTRMEIFDCIKNGFDIIEEVVRYDSTYEREYIDEQSVHIRMTFCGKLDELKFLDRVFDLKKTPSTDRRFKNAEGDIWQHTVNNDDWQDPFWFLDYKPFNLENGEDKTLLNFLCEMFHPAVRDEKQPWKHYLEKFNELLKFDGYELYVKSYISGRSVYDWKIIKSSLKVVERQMSEIKINFNSEYVDTQVDLMYRLIETAPHSAIGKAKELLEICCKTILDEKGIMYSTELDLIQLMKVACESIDLSPKKVPDGVKGKDIAGRILGNLANISQGMSELRNLYGDGHGKNKNFQPLPPRYANLAVGASVTAVHFMWDTYQERKTRKKL